MTISCLALFHNLLKLVLTMVIKDTDSFKAKLTVTLITAIYLQFPDYYCPVSLRGYSLRGGRTGTPSVSDGFIYRRSALLGKEMQQNNGERSWQKNERLNQQHHAEMQNQTIKKSVLLTQSKASKRSSFPKRQWLVNKPNYEWHSGLQVKHQSLADFRLNGFSSPTNVMALKVTCGNNNHWHKPSCELWLGFP